LDKKILSVVVIAIVIVAAVSIYWYSALQPSSPESKGGTLTVALSREPSMLDPTICLLGWPQFTALKALYDSLVTSDLNGSLIVSLAESYEHPDDLTYVFYLREDVKFHDGTPFNASCCVFMDNYIRTGPGTQGRADWMEYVESVEAVDEYTVKYTLSQEYPTFVMDMLRVGPTGAVVSPSAVERLGEDFGNHPVGTGPFKFVDWVKGSTITLEAYDDYWQGRAKIDKIVFKNIPEESVRMMEMQAGDIDLMEAPLIYANELSESGTVKLYTGASDRQMQLCWVVNNPDPDYRPYFTDKRVRQAVNYALDKQEIIDVVLGGWGWVSVGLVRYGYAGYAPYLEKYYHNTTKAKELLAEAGYSEGFECKLMCESREYRPYAEDAAVLIKDQLADVGIEVTIELVDKTTNTARRFAQQYELSMQGWRGSGLADTPHATIAGRYHSQFSGPGAGLWNYENINDSRIDYMIDRLTETPLEDVETWTVFSDEIQRISIEEAYDCPLWDRAFVHVSSLAVQGYALDPSTGSPLWAPNIGVEVWLNRTEGTQSTSSVMGGLLKFDDNGDLRSQVFQALVSDSEAIARPEL
jgi:peptide/nickel transport system substrate-binding protein